MEPDSQPTKTADAKPDEKKRPQLDGKETDSVAPCGHATHATAQRVVE